MMWLLYALAIGIVLFIGGGLDDQRRIRAEDRAELARAHRASMPRIPDQRTGTGR